MSGGAFDYNQYKIGYIADSIENTIEKNGRQKTREELKEERWRDPDWYKKYPEDLSHHEWRQDVIEKFKEAAYHLRLAEAYAHRVDWLLSGDDGEDTFLRRLTEDITNIKTHQDRMIEESNKNNTTNKTIETHSEEDTIETNPENTVEWIESTAGEWRKESVRLVHPDNEEPVTVRFIKTGWIDTPKTYHVITEWGAYDESDYQRMTDWEIERKYGITLP